MIQILTTTDLAEDIGVAAAFSGYLSNNTREDKVAAIIDNIFCKTGQGGGVDPTCTKDSPDYGDGGGGSSNYQQSLSGEYWLQDGMAMFADGDVGDMNHEGYAIQHAQYEVASAMDAPPEITDGDGVDWEGFENWMEDTHGNEDAQLTALKEAGVTDELYQVANGIGNIDPRSYAAEHWGWIRVLDNEAQMLEETQLSSLADGLADAHGEDVENQSFNIETKHAYYTNVPWAVISDGKPADLHEYKSHGSPGWGGHVQNVFCATGEGGGVDPTCTKDAPDTAMAYLAPRAERARKSYNPCTKEKQRESDAYEASVSRKLRAKRTGNNAPMDMTIDGVHGIELKVLHDCKDGRVNMRRDSRRRKESWKRQEKGRTLHTVLIDNRDKFEDGKHAHNFSGHHIYYSKGVGAFKLTTMTKVESFAELKRIILESK